ncbi:hypothetical protein [Streptomyces sp. NPDC055287]
MTELTSQIPRLKRILLDDSGRLRRSHWAFLNDELIMQPDPSMPLGDNDRITFDTAIASG